MMGGKKKGRQDKASRSTKPRLMKGPYLTLPMEGQ